MEMALNKRILLAEGKWNMPVIIRSLLMKNSIGPGGKICYNSGNKNTGYCSSSGH